MRRRNNPKDERKDVPGTDDVLADEATDSDLLRLYKRIAVLEAKAKKPWYREPSVVISVIALLGSAIGFINHTVQAYLTDVSARHAQLQQILKSVQTTRTQYQESSRGVSDNATLAMLGQATSNTVFILSSDAEKVADSLDLASLTCDELITLGDLWLDTARYQKAAVYFEQARTSASCQDWLRHGAALRELGRTYYAQSIQDLPRARDFFAQALRIFDAHPDVLSQYQYAYTMEGWAAVELGFLGPTDQARSSLQEARKRYEQFANFNNDAKMGLARVTEMLAKFP